MLNEQGLQPGTAVLVLDGLLALKKGDFRVASRPT